MIGKERKAVCISSIAVALLFLLAVVGVPNLYAQQNSIQWYSMQEAQKLAKQNGKKVLAYAEAEWCVYCQKMEKNVFPKQAVIDSLRAYFYPVRIDIESTETMIFNGKEISKRQFAQANNIRATPTTFFLNQNGKVMGGLPGYIPAETFVNLLAFMGSDAYQKMDFKMYIKQNAGAENK